MMNRGEQDQATGISSHDDLGQGADDHATVASHDTHRSYRSYDSRRSRGYPTDVSRRRRDDESTHSYRAESQDRSRVPSRDSQYQQRQRRGPSTSQSRNQDTGNAPYNRYDSRSIDRHRGSSTSRYDRSQSYATGGERSHHNNETSVEFRRGRSASVTSSRSESFLHRRRQFLSGSQSRSPGRMIPRPFPPPKMEVVEWPPCFDHEGSAFIFHPASGMFYEETSDFFYDPKTKLYYGVKKAAYYRYDEYQDPPFVETQRADPTQGTPLHPVEPPVTLPSVLSAAPLDNKPKIAIHLKTKKIKKPKGSVNTLESESNLIPLPTKVHKEQVANIEKWQEKQAELKAFQVPTLPPPPPSLGVTAPMALEEIKTTVKGEPICVICKRKFPTIDKLRLHETKSDLHKANLAKMTQLSVAIVESEKSDTAATPTAAGTSSSLSTVDAQSYHDRAEKRRRLHGPESASSGASVMSGKSSSAAKAETLEGIAETNVGNVLLQKMGWQSGSSLGKKGDEETTTQAAVEIRKDWDRIEAMASRSNSVSRSTQ